MSAETYNIPDHIKGNDFVGVQFNLTLSGSPVDLTGADIEMDLKIDEYQDTPAAAQYSISGGEIAITDAVNGQFEVLVDENIDLEARQYFYDIKITLSGPTLIKTYIRGKWEILQNIT